MLPLDPLWAINPLRLQPCLEALRQEMRKEKPTAGPAADAERDALPLTVSGTVAILPVRGVMLKGLEYARYRGVSSNVATRLAVEAAVADDAIESILLDVDSPGGSVAGLAELGDTLFAARDSKRVIAHVDGVCASAAYYVAAQAHEIYSGRMDWIGSIGTWLPLYDFSKMFEADGIEVIHPNTGPFKTAGAMGTKVTDEQRAHFQSLVDGFFDDFVAAIVRGRGMTEKEVRALADGREFFALQAIANGLIDGIKSMDDVLADLRPQSPGRRAPAAGSASPPSRRARAQVTLMKQRLG
ncbi:Putative signal peptide peptidase SppA [Planctomycetes bacterium Pan216]|uniref:Signal peptide peptidase SppA n=1 Tax=Kolteria novifilia TaxID=2527975 RepID=A0A518B5A9_9BACT|nr:Putative signal peptide peptidase SppA [Planctomycetes bacterium Pan216]